MWPPRMMDWYALYAFTCRPRRTKIRARISPGVAMPWPAAPPIPIARSNLRTDVLPLERMSPSGGRVLAVHPVRPEPGGLTTRPQSCAEHGVLVKEWDYLAPAGYLAGPGGGRSAQGSVDVSKATVVSPQGRRRRWRQSAASRALVSTRRRSLPSCHLAYSIQSLRQRVDVRHVQREHSLVSLGAREERRERQKSHTPR